MQALNVFQNNYGNNNNKKQKWWSRTENNFDVSEITESLVDKRKVASPFFHQRKKKTKWKRKKEPFLALLSDNYLFIHFIIPIPYPLNPLSPITFPNHRSPPHHTLSHSASPHSTYSPIHRSVHSSIHSPIHSPTH